MTDSKKGRSLHVKAEIARENGNFEKALKFTDEATLAYTKDKDYLGLAEIQSSRQSTFKHLFRQTKDKAFLILEKYAARSAVEIAQKSNNPQSLAIPYHNLAKYYYEARDYKNAALYFQKAVENLTKNPPKMHNRPAILADVKSHLYAAQFFAGDKSALRHAGDALKELKKAKENPYSKNVWLTGAHMRIAQMAAKENPDWTIFHLKEAEKIINSDKRLILRKKQLQELKANLKKAN